MKCATFRDRELGRGQDCSSHDAEPKTILLGQSNDASS